ncbi:hypothetical protein SESBI_14705 [Sesbania bispinosa]|nr:hypothetical protein SESBI_14705 [Sesbania bispinosa]
MAKEQLFSVFAVALIVFISFIFSSVGARNLQLYSVKHSGLQFQGYSFVPKDQTTSSTNFEMLPKGPVPPSGPSIPAADQ